MKVIFICLLLSCLWACHSRPKANSQIKLETDDRSNAATEQLIDISPLIDAYFNTAIAAARLAVNPTGGDWTYQKVRALTKAVSERLATARAGSGVGITLRPIILEVAAYTEIEAHFIETLSESAHEMKVIKFKDSCYGKNPIGVSIGRFPNQFSQAAADHSIAPVIRIADSLLGIDKLGHFVEQGYWLYDAERQALLKGSTERWQFGQFMEGDPGLGSDLYSKYRQIFGSYCRTCVLLGGFGYYGSASTGVISHADMMANEGGSKFYTDLAEKPETYHFSIASFDYQAWNEQVTPNLYDPKLLVDRPTVHE